MAVTSSYFLDALKLFCGGYNISDRDYMSLSDIILSFGLGELAQEGDLINLIILQDKYKFDFPCTHSYMKNLWEKEFRSISFNTILKKFVDYGLVRLQSVTQETLFGTDSIIKSPYDTRGYESYLVIYSTSILKDVLSRIKPFFSSRKPAKLDEAYMPISKNCNTVLSKIKSEIGNYLVDLQYCTQDDVLGNSEMGIVIKAKKLGDLTINDKELPRLASKLLGREQFLEDYEIYRDSRDSLYISLVVSNKANVSGCASIASKVLALVPEVFV